jgi:ankyrin repeat protein
LATMLENRQVTLRDDIVDGYENGLIYQAVREYGDAAQSSIEWLLRHGARINARGYNDWTALHLACKRGCLGAVKILLENGADMNAQTIIDGGWTPLMEACSAGKKDVVEFLLENGADPGIYNLYQEATARGIAANRGHDDVAALLDSYSAGSADRKRAAWKKKRKE